MTSRGGGLTLILNDDVMCTKLKFGDAYLSVRVWSALLVAVRWAPEQVLML